MPGVPEHTLLDDYGHDGSRESYPAGHGETFIMPRDDLLQAAPADAEAGREQDHAEHSGREAFEPVMPVGVIPVRPLLRELHADEGDEGREHIGQRMHRVRHHCAGVPGNARVELESNEKYVSYDADGGQPRDDFLFRHDKSPPRYNMHFTSRGE